MSKGYCYLQEEAKFKMAVGDVDARQNCIDDALQSFDRAHELLTKVMDRGYIASIENLVERYIYLVCLEFTCVNTFSPWQSRCPGYCIGCKPIAIHGKEITQ